MAQDPTPPTLPNLQRLYLSPTGLWFDDHLLMNKRELLELGRKRKDLEAFFHQLSEYLDYEKRQHNQPN